MLVDPNTSESKLNLNYINSNFIKSKYAPYIAPKYNYNNPKDIKLLKLIKLKKPKFIIINIGGGVQEKLAIWIFNKLDYKVNIICTGAAISFLTSSQAPINKFIDKLYLGWLMRCVYNPKVFFT